MFNQLQTCFRLMIGLWLLLIIGMSLLVSRTALSPAVSGNLLTYLFVRPDMISLWSPPLPPASAPVAEQTPPEPAVAAPAEPEPAPSDWRPVPRGRKAGSGVITRCEVIQQADGHVEVLLDYTGTVGETTAFNASNAEARSVDIHGKWSKVPYVQKTLDKGLLRKVQIADHKGHFRVTGILRSGKVAGNLAEDVSTSSSQLRIRFAAPQ